MMLFMTSNMLDNLTRKTRIKWISKKHAFEKYYLSVTGCFWEVCHSRISYRPIILALVQLLENILYSSKDPLKSVQMASTGSKPRFQ